jgi:transposase, IS30 family
VPRLSGQEKGRLAGLVAAGVPLWRICEVIGRDRWTTRRNINDLKRPPRPEPKRSPLRLWLGEREEFSRGLAGGASWRAIARRLGRAPSRISREGRGNGGARRYRACGAERAALGRMCRPKPAKLAHCERLRPVVEAILELRWSPQQISGWLVGAFPDEAEMRVSHETIYLSLFVQARGALRRELTRYLRRGHATRRPLGHAVTTGGGQLRGTIHISQRPAEANDRAVPGHGEGDLILGKHMSAVATLVERQAHLDAVAAELNDRPRQTLGWKSPPQALDEALR